MGNRRIIINYDKGLFEEDVIRYVKQVIDNGRVSVGANCRKHYCWITTFNDGVVVSVKPKYNTHSDIFTVYQSKLTTK